RVLAIANFFWKFAFFTGKKVQRKACFGATPKSAREARALPRQREPPSFFYGQITFDRLFEGLFEHVTEMRLAFDHRFQEFDSMVETDVRRQSRHFRLGDCFE